MDIFVSNLPFKFTEKELQELFEPFGNVESVNIVLDHKLRQSKGFGFVSMPTSSEAKEAIKNLRRKEIGGRVLLVSPASSKPKSSEKKEETKKPEKKAFNWKANLKSKIKKKHTTVTFGDAPKRVIKKHKKRRGQGRGTTY